MISHCGHVWKEITQTFMKVVAGTEYGGDGERYHYCCVKCLRIASTLEVLIEEQGGS